MVKKRKPKPEQWNWMPYDNAAAVVIDVAKVRRRAKAKEKATDKKVKR